MRVGVSGHQHIPRAALAFVKRGIARTLSETNHDLVGITSLAAGADQIFANIVLAQSGQLHVIVPCLHYEESFNTSAERREYRALLPRAVTTDELGFPGPCEEAFLAAGRRVVELSELLIAVWDGRPARGKGGTADIVEYAKSLGRRLEVIWPAGVER
jgi:hypothetical protein